MARPTGRVAKGAIAAALSATMVLQPVIPAFAAVASEGPVSQSDAVPSAAAADIFAGGTGTDTDPFQIATANQLKAFRDSVNAGSSYQGQYVKLTADVDLGNVAWTPIGENTTNYFKGTFDGGYGDGHVIKNLKVNGAGAHTGLFGYTWGANFKNVCLENVDVTGAQSTGALVSFAVGNIENCHVKGSIKIQGGNDRTNHFTAALAAQLYGNVAGCTVVGDDGSTITALGKVGAIVGFLRENEGGVYTVKNCTVKNVSVKATGSWQGDAGAIVGGAYLSTVIENCTAEDVAVSGNAAGGIIGLVENAIVRNGVVTTKDCNIHDNVVKNSTVNGSNSGYILGVYRTGSFGYGALPKDYATTSENQVVKSSGAKCNGDAGRDGDTFDGEPFKYATVTFAKNDGTNDSFGSKTSFEGGTVTALGSQKRDGYVFKGWYKDAACTEEFDFSQELSGDTTAYAGWTEAVASSTWYSVTTYYGSLQDALDKSYSNSTITLLRDTEESVTLPGGKKGTLELGDHKLTGDVLLDGGANKIKIQNGTINGTVKATNGGELPEGVLDNVTIAPVFTVTFEDADGIDPQNVTSGEKAFEPTKPSKAGYEFQGWLLNGVPYDFSTPVTGDITLTALWKYVGGTVTPPVPSPSYDITLAPSDRGTAALGAASAEAGERVTVTLSASDGFRAAGVVARDASGAELAVEAGESAGGWSFEMPASAVAVEPLFAASFADADYSQWYAGALDFVSSRGVMSGYADGTGRFGVGRRLTRAELAATLWNWLEPGHADDPGAADATGMADVADGQWYTAAANWAVASGVMRGYDLPGGRLFGPDDPVTLEQLCAVAQNVSGLSGSADLSGFADAAEVSAWAEGAVSWAVSAGLVSGSVEPGGLYLRPGVDMPRERVAAVVMNAALSGVL